MALPLFTRCRAISSSSTTTRHVSSHYPSSTLPPPSAHPLVPRTNPPSFTISTSPSITIPNFPQLDHHHHRHHHDVDRVHECQDHSMTLYDVLQIPPTATLAEVKASFRRLARLYHPDALAQRSSVSNSGHESATRHFLRIHAAYIALSDAQIRARYDLQLHFQSRKSDSTSHCGPKVGHQDVVGAHRYARYPKYGQSMRPGRSWETDQCW